MIERVLKAGGLPRVVTALIAMIGKPVLVRRLAEPVLDITVLSRQSRWAIISDWPGLNVSSCLRRKVRGDNA
ncbi:hypothetical protein AB9K34_03070 [Sedimentitalea sp. XS_ASV28]|uniref:hypothetical protein n=1 Tax=Sedimentitalea sp. XS_ASV28 TaxID=3241296 RepID=UPI00351416CB